MTIIHVRIQTRFLHQHCGHVSIFHDVEHDGDFSKIHLTLEIDGYPVELVNNVLMQVCMSYPEILDNPIIWTSPDVSTYYQEVYTAFDPDAIVDRVDGEAADAMIHDSFESVPDEQSMMATWRDNDDDAPVDDHQTDHLDECEDAAQPPDSFTLDISCDDTRDSQMFSLVKHSVAASNEMRGEYELDGNSTVVHSIDDVDADDVGADDGGDDALSNDCSLFCKDESGFLQHHGNWHTDVDESRHGDASSKKRAACPMSPSNHSAESIEKCEQKANRLFDECMGAFLNPLDFMKKGIK